MACAAALAANPPPIRRYLTRKLIVVWRPQQYYWTPPPRVRRLIKCLPEGIGHSSRRRELADAPRVPDLPVGVFDGAGHAGGVAQGRASHLSPPPRPQLLPPPHVPRQVGGDFH